MNIDKKIRMLLKLLLDLNDTIQRENDLLTQQANQETLRDVLEQKQALLGSYEQQVKLFKDNAELVNADHGLWRRLIDETDSFNKLIDENKLKLLSRIEVTKRIFAIIQDAAKDYKSSVSTYGKSGTTENLPQQPFQPAVSVGLNQEL
tara:strand:- start:29 stop:472 length:444 start_codon:yes stop_codon:yes gene_type:complete